MKVADIMRQTIATVAPDDSLRTARDLFDTLGYHHLLVVEGGVLKGVLSDRDLLRNISPFVGNQLSERRQDVATLDRRVHQIMSRKLVTASPATTVTDAAGLMLEARVHCLPVVNERGNPVGIISTRDLLAALCTLRVEERAGAPSTRVGLASARG